MKHVKEDGNWYTYLDFMEDGMGGVLNGKMKYKEQDKEFEPGEYYAVLFFPKIEGIGPAHTTLHCLDTISNSPEAAKMKFMDGICKSEKWEDYEKAGHKIRKILISDLGDA